MSKSLGNFFTIAGLMEAAYAVDRIAETVERAARGKRQEIVAPEPSLIDAFRRDAARKEKNWQEADRIRLELKSKGVMIEDTPGGTVWKVK